MMSQTGTAIDEDRKRSITSRFDMETVNRWTRTNRYIIRFPKSG